MSLQVWLPLVRDLSNQGLSSASITAVGSGVSLNDNGKLGKCYYFDGTGNGYMTTDFPTNIGTADFSISVWVKIPTITSGTYFAICTSKTNAAAGVGFGIYWNYSQKKFLWSTADGSASTEIWMATAVDDIVYDKWIHLVMVRNSSDQKIGYFYINGVRYELASVPVIRNIATSTNLNIGKTTNGSYPCKMYMNDLRIYVGEALSPKEIKLISQGLVCHYPLNQPFSLNNLVRNSLCQPYNNYSSSGSTATVVKTGSYNNCDIYRLTFTPNDTSLSHVQTSLHSHGICGYKYTFKANTKYAFWILWKPISHPDTVCGGTASNIGGWTEISNRYFGDGWYEVGQYRNGAVTTDKTDGIFISFKCPSATSGTPIIIDFCCPHLIEGYDYIMPENSYQLESDTCIYDCSGYNNHMLAVNALTIAPETARYSVSTHFNNGQYIVANENSNTGWLPTDSITVNLWTYITTWGNPISCTESGGWNFEDAGGSSGIRFPIYVKGVGYVYKNSGVSTSSLLNGWHMLTGTFDKTESKIYIDGDLKGTATASTSNIIQYSSARLCISAEAQGTTPASSTMVGNISDVRIYATALSADDVLELYHTSASIDKNGNLYAYELKEE